MADISTELVKELRELTGLGLMDIKKALTEAGGDKEKALNSLKEKGLAVAIKRADRDAREGLIAMAGTPSRMAMVKVSCETDFVAKTDDFKKLVSVASEGYMKEGEAFLTSASTKELVTATIGKTGEKVEIKDAVCFAPAEGFVEKYLHSNSKVGVLVELKCPTTAATKPQIAELAKDLSMHIAAMAPIALSPADVSDADKEEQKALFIKQMADSGKPPEVLEKIVAGKLAKHLADLCLLEMPFVKDPKIKVGDLVKKVGKEAGVDLSVARFKRMQIGK